MNEETLDDIKALAFKWKSNIRYKLTPEQLRFINDNTPLLQSGEFTLGTKLNWLIHGITEFPKCKVCGKEFRQNIKPSSEYPIYCSRKCANNDPAIKTRIRQHTEETCIRKYGCKNTFQVEEVKEKIKQTCLKKYGVEFSAQAECVRQKMIETFSKNGEYVNPFSREDVKEKIRQTLLERYGVEHPLQNKELLKKSQETCKKHYGVNNPLKSKEVIQKLIQNNLEKYGTEYPAQNEEVKEKVRRTTIERWGGIGLASPELNRKVKDTCMERYGREGNFAHGFSKLEKEVAAFVKSIYDGTVLENCFQVLEPNEQNGWKANHELDIYMPDLKLAIEFNGDYFHDYERFPDVKAKDDFKRIQCEEKGIQLLTVWEHDWMSDRSNVEKTISEAVEADR